MLVTDDARVGADARSRSCFGVESALSRQASDDLPVPVFETLGYNYKLGDLAAAVALVQLDRLPDLLAARRRVASAYGELLADLAEITLPVVGEDRDHTWQSYVVTLDPGVARGDVARHLREAGVQVGIGTFASHRQPVYGDRPPCPVSSSLFDRHLAIPMHANLSESDVEQVAAVLTEAVRAAR